MRKKEEGSPNRCALAGTDDLGESLAVDCADDYSAIRAALQGEILEKFAPKRRRAEDVAGVYGDLSIEQALSGYPPRDSLSSGEASLLVALLGKKRAAEFAASQAASGVRLEVRVHRLFADLLKRRASVVGGCGTFLEFHCSPDGKYLKDANFCKDRFCPLCNWRRSLKVFGQVSQVMDYLAPRRYRYLFLTLTVRNVWEEGFSGAVQALYDGWRVLYHDYVRVADSARCAEKRLKGLIKGTFRVLECTISKGEKSPAWRGSFHPHLHVILAVEESYFESGHYLTTADWRGIWRNCCKLDYDPQVKIEAVKPKMDAGPDLLDALSDGEISYSAAVAELSKYPFKDADFLTDYGKDMTPTRNLRTLLKGLSRRRLVGMTGCFRDAAQALKLDDAEGGDLVNIDPDALREDVRSLIVRYHWKCGAYVERTFSGAAHQDGGAERVEDGACRLLPGDLTPEAAQRRKRERGYQPGRFSDEEEDGKK